MKNVTLSGPVAGVEFPGSGRPAARRGRGQGAVRGLAVTRPRGEPAARGSAVRRPPARGVASVRDQRGGHPPAAPAVWTPAPLRGRATVHHLALGRVALVVDVPRLRSTGGRAVSAAG